MNGERERDVERKLKEGVEELGGVCLKWTSPGSDGVPDRIVILPGGWVFFVELKVKGGRLRDIQEYQIRRLRDLGCDVSVVYSSKGVERWLHEIQALRLSEEGCRLHPGT